MNSPKKTSRKLLATLLALAMTVSLAACSSDPEPVEASSTDAESSAGFDNTLEPPESEKIDFPEFADMIAEKDAINSDTVGWLEVPGTNINDVVVQKDDPADMNNYYWHRNFNQEQYGIAQIENYDDKNSWAFFADSRATLGDGKAESLPKNTVIYGHTVDTQVDENTKTYLASGQDTSNYTGRRFAALKFFLDEEFAKKTPYIYFSTGGEEMVWEVFSVFYSTVDIPYNSPQFDTSDSTVESNRYTSEELLTEVLDSSLYEYDVEVTEDDKLLTLSTCTYYTPDNPNYLGYPNNYRFVVMAKLVDRDEANKTEASFVGDEASSSESADDANDEPSAA